MRRRVDPSLAAIVGEGFFSRLSFGLISFALPLYAYREVGLSLTAVGALLSLNLAVAIVLKPIMGALADHFGTKSAFTAAIGLRSVVSLLLAFAAAPWQLFGIRAVHGVSISLRDPAVAALIAEHGGKRTVASAFAWYQTAKSMAGNIGKALAGVLLAATASNFSVVFLVAFALSLLPAPLVVRYVRERSSAHEPEQAVDSPLERESASPAAPPSTLRFAGLGFLVSGTAFMLGNLFPLLAIEYAGLTEAQTGLIYVVAMFVPLTGPVFGWLSDNVSRSLVLSLRSAANILSSVAYLVAPSFAGIAVGRALDDAGKAAFRPAWGALMAEVARFDQRRRARAMGAMSSGEDAGEMAGPVLAGLVWSLWGVPVLLGMRIGLAIVAEAATIRLGGRLQDAQRPPRHLGAERLASEVSRR